MIRRIVLPVCVALAVLTMGAGAYFTGRAEVEDNFIRAGEVAVSAEPTSAALSIDALAPGSVAVRPLQVVNDGNLPVNLVITAAKKAGITDFYEALTCRVTAGGEVIYDGPLSSMRTSALALPAGQRSEVRFAIGLPGTAGNELAGDYCKITVYLDAEQAH